MVGPGRAHCWRPEALRGARPETTEEEDAFVSSRPALTPPLAHLLPTHSETYQYYSLPFCPPANLKHKADGLGAVRALFWEFFFLFFFERAAPSPPPHRFLLGPARRPKRWGGSA